MRTLPTLAALVLLLLAPLAAAAQLRAEDAQGTVGSSATLLLRIAGGQGIGSVDLTIAYDATKLAVAAAQPGPVAPDALVETNAVSAGEYRVSMAIPQGVTGDGVLLQLTLELKAAGASTVELTNVSAYMASDFQDATLTPQAGRVTASAPAPTASTPASSTARDVTSEDGKTPGVGLLGALAALGLAAWAATRRRA